MKKIVVAFALLLTAQFSFAQDGFKEDMKKFLEVSGQKRTFEILTKDLVNNVPEDKKQEFQSELNKSLDGLMDKMAEVYMEEFTQDETKELIRLYETPIGKKLSEKTDVLYEKGQNVGQEWGIGLQGLMMKYMQ